MEPIITPRLVDLTHDANTFFTILPDDWSQEIMPVWEKYEKSGTKIYAFELTDEIIGGGIVFQTVSPDTMAYASEAEKLLEAGLSYFGFLWITPDHRNKQLGSRWIKEVQQVVKKPLWLSIEDPGLKSFYEQNNFRVFKEISLESGNEWIMIPKESNLL